MEEVSCPVCSAVVSEREALIFWEGRSEAKKTVVCCLDCHARAIRWAAEQALKREESL
jgi:hypothetical protein